MQTSSNSNHLRKFLAIDGLFEGGRMFVGATSVTYLLSVGVSFQDVAALKSIQAFVLIFGEVPTGVLADSFGRKFSLVLGGLSAILGFLIFYFSTSFILFGVAEALTALSLCFWSGAYESCAIDTAKLEHAEGRLSQFFHLNMSCNSAAVMFFGLIGGYIGAQRINLPYLGAVACYIVMLYLIYTLPAEIGLDGAPAQTFSSWFAKIKVHMAAAFREGLLHPVLLPFFLANIGIQFLIQPLLHYWQPYFRIIDPFLTLGQQGFIFSTYCGVIAIFSYIYSRLSSNEFVKKPVTVAILFGIFSILYFSLAYSHDIVAAVTIFALLQGFLTLCRTSLSIKMNEAIESKSRASILSTMSLVSRIGMMGALAMIAKMVDKSNSRTILDLYRIFGALSFVLIILLLAGMYYSKRGNGKKTT